MLESALPELYAVIVFSVKARTFFEARGTYIICVRCYWIILNYIESGMKGIGNKLKTFDLEFQPFIEGMNAKARAIQDCANAVTMGRIKGMNSTYS